VNQEIPEVEEPQEEEITPREERDVLLTISREALKGIDDLKKLAKEILENQAVIARNQIRLRELMRQ